MKKRLRCRLGLHDLRRLPGQDGLSFPVMECKRCGDRTLPI